MEQFIDFCIYVQGNTVRRPVPIRAAFMARLEYARILIERETLNADEFVEFVEFVDGPAVAKSTLHNIRSVWASRWLALFVMRLTLPLGRSDC